MRKTTNEEKGCRLAAATIRVMRRRMLRGLMDCPEDAEGHDARVLRRYFKRLQDPRAAVARPLLAYEG